MPFLPPNQQRQSPEGTQSTEGTYSIHFFTQLSSSYLPAQQHTHAHPFSCPFSGTTRVSQYKKGKTNLDFTEATDSEWQWHQLGHM